jgi:hypothetical protein
MRCVFAVRFCGAFLRCGAVCGLRFAVFAMRLTCGQGLQLTAPQNRTTNRTTNRNPISTPPKHTMPDYLFTEAAPNDPTKTKKLFFDW